MRKIELRKEECYCSLMALYDTISEKLGYNPSKVKYDCRKIQVSEDIQNEVYLWYRENNDVEEKDMCVIWLHFGPKVFMNDKRKNSYYVEVEKSFIVV